LIICAPHPLIIIDRVTPRSRKRGPEYCLPAEHLNPVQKNPQEILVFCTLGPPPSTWDSRGGRLIYTIILYSPKRNADVIRNLICVPFCYGLSVVPSVVFTNNFQPARLTVMEEDYSIVRYDAVVIGNLSAKFIACIFQGSRRMRLP